MRDLLLEKANPCLHAHLWALAHKREQYLEAIRQLRETGAMADVSGAVKARVLAALHTCSEHESITTFLPHCEATDIVKALTLLDRPRLARQLLSKIQKIENEHPSLIVPNSDQTSDIQDEDEKDDSSDEPPTKKRKRKRMIDVYRKQVKCIQADLAVGRCQSDWCCQHGDIHSDTAVQERVESTSVSGSLARKIRAWAKTALKADFLEFVILSLPMDPWRKLADLVHFAPSDFAVSYFLAAAFGCQIPEDSFVARMRGLSSVEDSGELSSAFLSIANDFPEEVRRQYSYLRNQSRLLSQASVTEYLATNIPLETVIWYFEELYQSSRKCSDILQSRLRSEEDALAESIQSNKSKATYGKLVERLLKFERMNLPFREDLVPLADRRLGQLKELHHARAQDLRVAVFGDASASMQRAIEAAAIFVSMVSTCLNGELSFFNRDVVRSPYEKPSNVQETLEVCHKIRANNCTSLASALWPYYASRKVMDLFVMVTDEEENTPYQGFMFASLLAKYKEDVNRNVQLIVVTVGSGDRSFRNRLAHHGIEYKTVTIDGSRPDLTKFDGLLEQLAAMSSAPVPMETESETVTEKGAEKDEFVLV